MRKQYLIYIVVMIVIMLIPFIGMSVCKTTEETEKRELAPWPSVYEESGVNVNYLTDLGAWFEDHMAFRQNMITAYAFVLDKLSHYSSTDQVVIGKNGWLYFGGSVEDYTSTNQLSERELNNIVHNITLLQAFVEEHGSQFLLVIAPNKNTLYGENMPYYYSKVEESNLERLQQRFHEAGIHSVDVVSNLKSNDDVLYFKRDTHWNNKGALIVYNQILDYGGIAHDSYANCDFQIVKDHTGDLDELLYPAVTNKEENYIYDIDYTFDYVNDVKSNMDDWIQTYNEFGKGNLLMYRDSFGESLLPFFAQNYENAYFSRMIPYDMADLERYQPDTVIVEKVERQLDIFGTEVPMMPGPKVHIPSYENGEYEKGSTNSTINLKESGDYVLLGGVIDESCLEPETKIYVAVNGSLHCPFYTLSTQGDGNGYRLYLNSREVGSQLEVSVFVENGGRLICVGSDSLTRS
ncbi:MAG: hypothetical protein ACI4F4_02945 [Lachnospiraceae bacterium]